MKAAIRVNDLPSPYRKPVRSVCRKLLALYPNTLALVVIGSVALGSWEEDSDLDLVWVVRGRRRKKWREELGYDYSGLVELVTFNLADVRRHLAWQSPMAHAIRRGVIVYDPERWAERLRRAPVGRPTREWMQEWFRHFWHRLDWGRESYRMCKKMHRRYCKTKCGCQVSEVLTRAVVNLALILLTTRGIVPNAKAEMRLHYPTVISGARRRRAMGIALQAHHVKRDLKLDEARKLLRLGDWLRTKLAAILGKPDFGPPKGRRAV
jgi:predicted nucleotidyltransferase